MALITIEYDPATGRMSYPDNGEYAGSWIGLDIDRCRAKEEAQFSRVAEDSLNTLARLKAAGFTAEDIIKLSKAGICCTTPSTC